MKHFKFFEPLTMGDVDAAEVMHTLLTATHVLETLKTHDLITQAEYWAMIDKVKADARKYLGLPELPADQEFKTINELRAEAGLPPMSSGRSQLENAVVISDYVVSRQLLRDMEHVCKMYQMLAKEVPGVAQRFLSPSLLDRTEKEIQMLLSGRSGKPSE